MTIGNSPELSQIFDVARIFMQVARLNGAKNVNEFIKKGGGANFNQMDNQQVLSQAQAGNIIPVDEAMQLAGGGAGG
jgi:hypothetical protein